MTITGIAGGTTRTALMRLEPPAPGGNLTAQMSVRSARGGDTCQLNAAAGTTECTFDATGSTGPITVFRWAYVMAGGTGTHLATTVTSSPVTTCALAGGGTTLLDDRGAMYTLIEVTLRAGDATGAFSAPATRRIALYTNARCGYPA